MYFLLVSIVLLVSVLYWLKLAHDNSRYAKDIPGPETYPLIGSAHLFIGSEVHKFQVVCELFQKYTHMFRLPLGPKTILCLSDPDLIQQALTTSACQDKAFFYRFLEMEHGLVSARYDEWKQYRKMLNPAFNQRILVSFISIFSRCAETMANRMAREEGQGRPFDVLHYVAQCTLEMVCASSLKSDITDDPLASKACHGLEKIATIAGSRVFNLPLYNDLIFAMTRQYRELQRQRFYVKAVFDPILFKRRDEIQQQRLEKTSQDEEEGNYRKPMVFLDQLLHMQRDGQELGMEEIENHLYTIIGAGNETTANQVSYILWLLALHPEVQERVYKEIQHVYDGDVENITHEQLAAQTYLEQVIKETMRLFPVASLIGRETIEPMKLGKALVPPGVTILINMFTLHRRKDLWGDRADQFDPDRFDPSVYDARKHHPHSYIPFGGGPRNCIGYKYAILAMKVIVTKVASRYQLSTPLTFDDPLQLSFAVTLKLGAGYLVKIKRREIGTRNEQV